MKNIETIISADNTRIKALKKLAIKKYRYETGRFMIENLAIIQDALQSGYDAEEIFVTQDFIDRHQIKFDYLKDNSQAQIFLINEKLNKYYSQLDTPSGVTAVYQIKEDDLDPERSVLYLNGVNDPGNLGTIMRTALAFDFINLVLDGTCADIYNAKTLNAAKDAVFKLRMFKDQDGSWLNNFKASWPVYSTSSHQGIDLEDFIPAEKYCLILGSESHGVSPEMLQSATGSIKIDISDQIESLNVASAAAILLYRLKTFKRPE